MSAKTATYEPSPAETSLHADHGEQGPYAVFSTARTEDGWLREAQPLRNLSWTGALAEAGVRQRAGHTRVHVSLDTCG